VRFAYAAIAFVAISALCEGVWTPRTMCYGPFTHRHMGCELFGDEYGISFSPLGALGGNWPSARFTTLHAGPLGAMPATRGVATLLACFGGLLVFSISPRLGTSLLRAN
jgi:hypothetical protein